MALKQFRASELSFRKVPFEQLPNLPKPRYSPIDLGISRSEATTLSPAITDRRRIGYFKADQSTQTEESDIVELKEVSGTIKFLVEDIRQLRNDLSYARNVMRRDYENKINERAAELYSHANQRVNELEKLHTEKIDTVRKSYRSQLSNAISKIAGEYKVYYEELLQGKTGRHDARIKELKQQVSLLEQQLEQSEEETNRLKEAALEAANGEEDKDTSNQFASAFSSEKEEELRLSIVDLERELDQAQADLAEKDDAITKFRRQSESLNRQLAESKMQVAHLKQDMETLRRQSMAEVERMERLAQGQRDALEKEMSEKMLHAERSALARASEIAEMQRMKDLSRFQQQMEERKNREDELRRQASRQRPAAPPPETELSKVVDKLRKKSEKQEQEIVRLTKELDRTNRVWETKLSIMQKNFHALKDESFVRQQFQRQHTLLHYASVGYAATNQAAQQQQQQQQPKQIRSYYGRAGRRESAAAEGRGTAETLTESLPGPTPTPVRLVNSQDIVPLDPEPERPRSVHFEERGRGINPQELETKA